MLEVLSWIMLILWVIIIWNIYHRIFFVHYFGANGILKEFIIIGIIAFLMTGLSLMYWIISDIIIVFGGIAISHRNQNKSPLVLAGILTVIVTILGIAA